MEVEIGKEMNTQQQMHVISAHRLGEVGLWDKESYSRHVTHVKFLVNSVGGFCFLATFSGYLIWVIISSGHNFTCFGFPSL